MAQGATGGDERFVLWKFRGEDKPHTRKRLGNRCRYIVLTASSRERRVCTGWRQLPGGARRDLNWCSKVRGECVRLSIQQLDAQGLPKSYSGPAPDTDKNECRADPGSPDFTWPKVVLTNGLVIEGGEGLRKGRKDLGC